MSEPTYWLMTTRWEREPGDVIFETLAHREHPAEILARWETLQALSRRLEA